MKEEAEGIVPQGDVTSAANLFTRLELVINSLRFKEYIKQRFTVKSPSSYFVKFLSIKLSNRPLLWISLVMIKIFKKKHFHRF